MNNNTQPELSIIIPHYNIPSLLAKLIESIPKYDTIQIIVVDDNSTKNVEELDALVASCKDRNFEFYRNEKGKNSAGACRNIGIEHAKGKWIMYADADDYFVDGWYDTVQEYFDSEHEMVYFLPTSINMSTGLPDDRHEIVTDKLLPYMEEKSEKNELRLHYNNFAVWSVLYKRSFIEDHGIRFEPVICANDVHYSTQCGHHVKDFVCTDKTIYCVTRRENSLTTALPPKNFDTRQKVAIRRLAFLYKTLSAKQIHMLGVRNGDFAPLYVLIETIKRKEGINRNIFSYRKMMRQLKVPLVNWRYVLKHPISILRAVLKATKG